MLPLCGLAASVWVILDVPAKNTIGIYLGYFHQNEEEHLKMKKRNAREDLLGICIPWSDEVETLHLYKREMMKI